MNVQETTRALGRYLPSKNIAFADSANLTAIELLTFFPNSINSPDVVYRFVSNGATRDTLWRILNTTRESEKEFSANSCGRALYKAMRQAGYEGWTIGTHDRYHEPRKGTWDEKNLGVKGFRVPCEIGEDGKKETGIPFVDLAVDVRQMPTGYDALDLTAMVLYCVQKEEDTWLYPEDYDRLLELMGGPHQITQEHIDQSAFRRWDNVQPPRPRPRPSLPVPKRQNGQRKEEKTKTGKREGKRERNSTEGTAASLKSSRGRTKKFVRTNGEDIGGIPQESNKDDNMFNHTNDKYVRGNPTREAVPQVDDHPTDEQVCLAFWAEGDAHESDPFSPYAFLGPRHRAPFRPLHRIGTPHEGDVGGWAENLRWAAEQMALFKTRDWNESPEHMEKMVRIRKEQMWASTQLLASMDRDEERWETEAELLGAEMA